MSGFHTHKINRAAHVTVARTGCPNGFTTPKTEWGIPRVCTRMIPWTGIPTFQDSRLPISRSPFIAELFLPAERRAPIFL